MCTTRRGPLAGRLRAKSAFVAFALVISAVGVLALTSHDASAYSPHAPISITGNSEFTVANGVTGGSGTAGDPYIISDWEISSDSKDGISILNTDAYLFIKGVYVHGSSSHYGISLQNVLNAGFDSCLISWNYVGMYLENTRHTTIDRCTLSDNDFGIEVNQADDLLVSDCHLESNGNSFSSDSDLKNMQMLNTKVDNSSYDAFAVYGDTGNVSLINCTMRHVGSGYGILFYGAVNSVDISRCNVSSNQDGGIYVEDVCDGLAVTESAISDNGYQGIFLSSGGSNCTFENNSIERNLAQGISIVGGSSSYNTIRYNDVAGNGAFGIEYEGSETTISENSVLDHPSDGGIMFYGSDVSVENNTLVNNSYLGIFVGHYTQGAVVANNTMTDCGLFIDFDYTTGLVVKDNTANGLPILFLDGVVGMDISSGVGQVIAVNCARLNIHDIDLSRASIGVEFWNTDSSVVERVTATNSTCGVYLRNHSSYVTIRESNLSGNIYGAYSYNMCDSSYVLECDLSHCEGYGFVTMMCDGAIVLTNQMNHCGIGMMSWWADNITLSQNDISWSTFSSVYALSCSGLLIAENDISDSGTGMYAYSVSNSIFSWNLVTNCTDRAFHLQFGDSNAIHNNTFGWSRDGVYLEASSSQHSTGNIIRDNAIQANSRYGIYMDCASGNTICWNNISGNQYGIYIPGSSSPRNWIYLNNFANAVNAYSGSSANNNYWNTSSPVDYWWGGVLRTGHLGNYWSDYSGADADNNGVGDTPYSFAGEQDNYPLMGENYQVIPEFGGTLLPVVALLSMIFALMIARRPSRDC